MNSKPIPQNASLQPRDPEADGNTGEKLRLWALSGKTLQQAMWHRLKNLFSSLWTYEALSPDLKLRRRVNRALRHRPNLSADDWFESFCKKQGVTYPIATFAYTHLEQYSGLEFGRTLPSDRLNEDLHWTQVCWFDWQFSLCDDFWQAFAVDISVYLDELDLSTVEDLIIFLNYCWTNQQGVKL